MGKKDIAATYYRRAAYYKNLYDAATRQMRGKNSKGSWRSPFDPLMATSPMNNPGDYTEANAWQYFWTPAQNDVEGMMQLLGGKKNFTAQLDSFFTIKAINPNKHLGQEAMIGQYAHGNEPSHHIAYLYAYTDNQEKGRAVISKIYDQFYGDTPTGMIGNDDCGQMSAWYIFTTLGFYPVNPSNGEFTLGMPQVKKAVVKLANQQTLTITNQYINGEMITELNGNKITAPVIPYRILNNGGALRFSRKK
jgi:predicted alpha-1,2-mannosidase